MPMITPNMNMPSPIPANTPGPEWSYDIASCLSIIDSHDHSSGKGVQIAPNGININADLPFNGHNATLLKTARFSAQSAPLTSSSPDVGCLYVSGNELYFNDVSGGHQVQITTNGSVNAGAGSITGLPSGTASASFSAGTFVWQSATNTAANLDARSIVLRNSTASSKGLTLNPPAAMAADFSLTLPSIPGASAFLTIDSSGNFGTGVALSGGIGSSNIAAGGVARTNLVAVGQQIAGTGTSFSLSGATYQDITGCSVSLTTSGRPVVLALAGLPIAAVTPASFRSNVACFMDIRFLRGATEICTQRYSFSAGSLYIPPSMFSFLDTPAAGSYTYKAQISVSSGAIDITTVNLAAYEL